MTTPAMEAEVATEPPRPTYPLIDFDNHYYEPDDCFTRHMPAALRERAINIRRRSEGGRGRVFIGDDPYVFYRVTQTDYIAAPGAFRDYFEGKVDKPDIGDRQVFPREIPGFMEPSARLEMLQDQGVDVAVMFPTLYISVSNALSADVEMGYANLTAFNRWLEDDWGFDRDGKIISAPMMLLADPDLAVAELERVLNAGARVIGLVPGPVQGRSPADPVFDPFWARVAEAGIPAAFHAGDSGFQYLYGRAWGEEPDRPYEKFTPLQHFFSFVERPIVDTLAAVVLQNLFGRFPSLRIISVENGCSWVADLLKTMDKAYRSHRDAETIGGRLTEMPSETFRTNVWVSPFGEDDVVSLIGTIGAEHAVMGSDYPHPEGMVAPMDFVGKVAGLPPRVQRQFLRDNGASLLGIES